MFEPQKLWLGSLSSYLRVLDSFELTPEVMKALRETENEKPDIFDSGFQILNGTAILEVNGPLVPTTSFFSKLFGLTGYDELRTNLYAAATHPDVKSVLLNMDSPGGAVTGVKETADAIRKVGQIKPVSAHTSGMMMSGAYWLGSAAQQITASELASVGSIGVILVHEEISKLLENEGVKVTVFRQGKYKALGSPVEPLSDAAKAHIESRMKTVYDVFVRDVAAGRGKPADYIAANAAEGKEFWGFEGVSVGLVDQVASLEESLHILQSNNHGTSVSVFVKPSEATAMRNNPALTPEQAVAALGAGGDPAELAGVIAAAEPSDATDTAEPAAPEPTPPADDTSVSVAPVVPTSAAVEDAVLTMLKSEVKDLRAEALSAQVEIHSLKAQVEHQDAMISSLKDVAVVTVSRLQVALGMSAMDATKLDVTALVELHASLQSEFQKRFKVGAQAKVPVDGERAPKPAVEPQTRVQRARLEAVK
jgi:signal peptide peptidase SppA